MFSPVLFSQALQTCLNILIMTPFLNPLLCYDHFEGFESDQGKVVYFECK